MREFPAPEASNEGRGKEEKSRFSLWDSTTLLNKLTVAPMKRIALFGGAFDPPHIGHRGAIRSILAANAASEVWLIPTGDRHDKTVRATAPQRVAMLEAFLQENFSNETRVRLDLCQVRGLIGGSYTIDLLRYFKSLHPDSSFLFVIGSDLIPQLPSWKEADSLFQETEFLVLPRPGFSTSVPTNAKISILSCEFLRPSSASSSEARKLLGAEKATAEVLTPAVASYIEQHQLYRA